MIPQTAFLLSVAGLGVSLAGFSGLVGAFRRGAAWKPIDAYRLRQIPEMGLAATLIALATIPLSDTLRAQAALQVASGAALLFTVAHIVTLALRMRRAQLPMSRSVFGIVTLVDLTIVIVGASSLALGSVAAYEWLLVFLLARPILAFVCSCFRT